MKPSEGLALALLVKAMDYKKGDAASEFIMKRVDGKYPT